MRSFIWFHFVLNNSKKMNIDVKKHVGNHILASSIQQEEREHKKLGLVSRRWSYKLVLCLSIAYIEFSSCWSLENIGFRIKSNLHTTTFSH